MSSQEKDPWDDEAFAWCRGACNLCEHEVKFKTRFLNNVICKDEGKKFNPKPGAIVPVKSLRRFTLKQEDDLFRGEPCAIDSNK
jgi:hypothetical protein